MELQTYIDMARRRIWIIVIAVAVAVAIASVGFLQMKPDYVASATLRATQRSGTTVDYGSLEYAVRLKNTYAQLATSGPLIDALQLELGESGRSSNALRESISADFPTNNELMTIVVRDPDPALAAQIANGVAQLLINESQTSGNRQFTLSFVDPAVVPSKADRTSSLIVVVFAAVIALGAGIGLALLLEVIDTTLHSSAQIAAVVNAPILARVPRISRRQPSQCYNGLSPEGEAFRQLRTNLAFTGGQKLQKPLLITSAEPGEGKSLISANLAYSHAQLQQRVVVVDTDLRLPALHKIFKISNDIGLGQVLQGLATLDQAIHYDAEHKLYVLPSGTATVNPADLLNSDRMRSLATELIERFDIVIFDTPAYLAVADTAILSNLAEGVVFVVRCEKSQLSSVQAAYNQLLEARVPVFGVVANAAEKNKGYQYYQKQSRRS